MKHTTIGSLPAHDGADWYYLLELEEGDVGPGMKPLDVAGSLLMSHVYRDTFTPGAVYCHTVLITPFPYSDTKFIGIAEVRYDV